MSEDLNKILGWNGVLRRKNDPDVFFLKTKSSPVLQRNDCHCLDVGEVHRDGSELNELLSNRPDVRNNKLTIAKYDAAIKLYGGQYKVLVR